MELENVTVSIQISNFDHWYVERTVVPNLKKLSDDRLLMGYNYEGERKMGVIRRHIDVGGFRKNEATYKVTDYRGENDIIDTKEFSRENIKLKQFR